MRVIKKSTLRSYWRKHPDAREPLQQWLQITLAADWQSIQDARRDFPHADAAIVASGHTVTIFNIGGNKYRLVVAIKYRFGTVYIRDFVTHAEYGSERWKQRH